MKPYIYGKFAEDFVANVLLKQGWILIARNFRKVGLELDIVAIKNKTMIFVEVKYRRIAPKTMRDWNQILTQKKRMALERGAKTFLQIKHDTLPDWETLRFDLAIVYPQHSQPHGLLYAPGI